MKASKGTQEFEAYVRNLQRAVWITSVGAQLSTGDMSRSRGPMVHNPYKATIAELSICHFRPAATATH